MANAETAFARSQTTRRITNVIMLLGVIGSIVMAFPLMIGLNAAYRDGTPFLFFVPFAAAAMLTAIIRLVRK